MIYYFDLTAYEQAEFNQLKDRFFGTDKFVALTAEQENSPEFKRYDELLKKKMKYLYSITPTTNTN
jgi:hypothetical protein